LKISGARAARFAEAPDPTLRAILLHGPDPALSARLRRSIVAAVTEGDDLRLTRLEAEAIRRDPGSLHAALRERGFFGGRRVVLVEGVRDSLGEAVAAALDGSVAEDALLLLAADDRLPARGPLCKLFEAARDFAAVAVYPEAAGDPAALGERLRALGAPVGLTREGEAALATIAAECDATTLDGLLGTLALYALDREAPIEAEELRALSPLAAEASLDALVGAVAAGEGPRVVPLMRRLEAGGTRPEAMLSALRIHFRNALAALADPAGPRAAAERLHRGRYNPRRDAFLARLSPWSLERVEAANRAVFQTERALRSPGERPAAALVERCLVRLSMMARGR
jgi:DNA polymerase-3 subunit delta